MLTNMNKPYDLLQLMFNISQLHKKPDVIEQYVEGMNVIFKPADFSYRKDIGKHTGSVFEISTGKSQFGFILVQAYELSEKKHLVLIDNSVKLLAKMIAHIDYEQRLEKERDGFESLATVKLEELGRTVTDLENARVTSINLIEDLTVENERRKEAELEIKKSEQKFRDLYENMAEGVALHKMDFESDGIPANYRIIDVNPKYEKMLSLKKKDIIGRKATDVYKVKNAPYLKNYFDVVKTRKHYEFESYFAPLNKYFSISVSPWGNDGFATIFSDITDRKNAENEIKINEARLEGLLRIVQYQTDNTQEFLDFALNEAIAMTQSKIGYIYFYDDIKKEFTLNSWSEKVMEICSIMEPKTVYQLDKTGIWGEAVRQRKPIMLNDFQANHHLKKGYPEGHAPLNKYLTIPVFIGDKIVAVIGVANKIYDYTEADVRQLTIMMESVWSIVQRKDTEKLIKENEQKFRELYENMVQGVFYQLSDGTLVDINPAGLEMFGISYDQFLGRTSYHPEWKVVDENLNILKPEEHPSMVALNSAHDVNMFVGVFNPDKKDYKWLSVNAKPQFKKGDSKPAGVFVTMHDITERKQYEEKLRFLSSRNEAILGSVPDIIMEVDNNKIYSWANKSGYEFFGDDVIGRKADYYFEGEQDTYKKVNPLFDGSGDKVYIESWQRRRDGQKRLLAWWCKVLKNENGDVTGVLSSASDITELRNAEDALRESEGKFRSLFENSPLGKSMTAIDGSMFVNKSFCEILGYPEKDLLSKNWKEFTHPDDIKMTDKIIKSMLAGKIDRSRFEKRYIHRNGSIVWTDVSTFLQRDHEGNPLYFITTIADITDRKKAQDAINILNEELENKVVERTLKLEAANKELEAFSYSVSHDLRAPLRAIHSYTKILQEDYISALDAEGHRLFDIIESSSVQMGQLIDDLLAFSRVGRSGMHIIRISMSQLSRSVYEELTMQEERDRIKFSVKKIPSVYADFSLIKQVMTNFISNAIKYTSKNEKAEIVIGSETERGEIIYFIKDNGVGFDMQYVNKLFGVFQRLHSRNEFEGNGVGLAIVQRIIVRHGGRVWAESEVGKGATFFFTLPIKDKS